MMESIDFWTKKPSKMRSKIEKKRYKNKMEKSEERGGGRQLRVLDLWRHLYRGKLGSLPPNTGSDGLGKQRTSREKAKAKQGEHKEKAKGNQGQSKGKTMKKKGKQRRSKEKQS